MALPEFQRELTDGDKLYIFKRSTAGMEGGISRWEERAQAPMTDDEVRKALEFEIGHGGGAGPDTPGYAYNSSGLRIWGHWDYPNVVKDKPLWAGAATIPKAREGFGIKTPEEFAEPSLFDFAGLSAT